MQHDVGADFKVPLPMYSGRHDDWLVWSARFGAHAELALDRGARGSRSANSADHDGYAIRQGKIINAVLLTKTEGEHVSIVNLTQ